MVTQYKYGLLPAPAGALPLQLRAYLTPSLLPSADSLPKQFGHDGLIGDWGMFLNDRIGDCAPVSAVHTTMLLLAEAGKTVNWDQSLTATNSAAVNYSAITGYQPGPELADPRNAPQNPTDRGTDIGSLMRFWQDSGIVDGDGNRHPIVGFAGVGNDWDELLIALRLFQAVQIGIAVPAYAEDQFAAGQSWHLKHGLHRMVGGHCIPGVARAMAGRVDAIRIVTWDKEIVMERPFFERYCMTAAVGFSEEMLTDLRSIDGVDDQQLRADLPLLNIAAVA